MRRSRRGERRAVPCRTAERSLVSAHRQQTAAPAAFDPERELARQVETLVALGYPGLAGLDPAALRAMVAPLRRPAVAACAVLPPPTRARVPFVVVVSRRVVPPSVAMTRTSLGGLPGFVSADTADIDGFEPIGSLEIPAGAAYLAVDVDRGAGTRGATPDEGLVTLAGLGRSPLTVDEGIAFVTAFPDALERNNCFQLAGSRRDDRRVPGIWISGRRPKLGFCWAGNRHTWLGLASCRERVGAG